MSIGQPESSECPPLTRRMNFSDCAATVVWQCGTADDSLREADVVTKSDDLQVVPGEVGVQVYQVAKTCQ